MVKNNSALRVYIFLFLGFSFCISTAQNSIKSEAFEGLSAFENFQSRKYKSVISDLNSKSSLSDDEEILLLLSELKTGRSREEEIEGWLTKNQKHPIKPLVRYHLGEYYFYSGDTLKSKNHLGSVSSSSLTNKDQASYGYVFGLLRLNEARYNDALNLFQFARKKGFAEVDKLDYYTGFTSYHLGNTEEALANFERVQNTQEFGSSSKFFIAKMRLDNGESDDVIFLAQSELSDEKTITNSGFHQLIGEAYALKDQEAKADAFFERAIELHPTKPSAALYYQAGVSKFKIGNEDQAIKYLTEAGIQGGEYAQLSAFQLGRLYLKKESYENALIAYIEASASEDQTIKEESYFQSASINAKLGQFNEAIAYAIDYLDTFKESNRKEAMQDLVAQSYLRTSNYDLAIEHLNKIGISNSTQKSVYQKVTYQKAVLSFNDTNFLNAQKWFNESLKFTPDLMLRNSSHYHLAEMAMRSGRYDEAIRSYKNQSTIDALTNYGLGYAYYNKQEYNTAITYFREASNASEANIRSDASVRLADCYYATKSYQEAFNIYNQKAQELNEPYLTYQKGMSLKSMDRGNKAIESFEQLFSNSRYAPQAIYQSGLIQFESANFTEAVSYFSQVIEKQSNSQYLVESLLNRGISKKNLGELESSQADYESILKNHMNSEIAINAILGLQELQQAGLDVQNLDKYISQYKEVNPESGSLELIEFEAAKRLYFDFSYGEAAQAFAKYLIDYPNSGNRIEANYYQADSYYRINELELARPLFDELKFVRNPLTGRILNRLGVINMQLNYSDESEEAYQLLADLNLSQKDNYNATQGLMLLYFNTERYNDAITTSNEILSLEWKPLNAEQEALVIKARSWFNLEDYEKSKLIYHQLASGIDAYGAEANYHLGLIEFQNEEYDQSLDLLFALNSNYGSYTEWVDKSYFLIAKNYIEMGEMFQAKATLRSIIQHSKNEVVKENSRSLLVEIEQDVIQSDSTQNKD